MLLRHRRAESIVLLHTANQVVMNKKGPNATAVPISLVDPVRLESQGFLELIYGLAHGFESPLLSYARAKEHKLEEQYLIILQDDPQGHYGSEQQVRVQLGEAGDLIVDANVTGRASRGRASLMAAAVVDTEDVAVT